MLRTLHEKQTKKEGQCPELTTAEVHGVKTRRQQP